jgi:hypothetical protein
MKALIWFLTMTSLLAMSTFIYAEPELKPAAKPGLFGAPLPEGSAVIKKHPKEGLDETYVYRIKATATQIIAFYEKHMALNGWFIYTPSNKPNRLIYQKGNALIVISVDEANGIFSLKGHQTQT